jgi:hypothetical protein
MVRGQTNPKEKPMRTLFRSFVITAVLATPVVALADSPKPDTTKKADPKPTDKATDKTTDKSTDKSTDKATDTKPADDSKPTDTKKTDSKDKAPAKSTK